MRVRRHRDSSRTSRKARKLSEHGNVTNFSGAARAREDGKKKNFLMESRGRSSCQSYVTARNRRRVSFRGVTTRPPRLVPRSRTTAPHRIDPAPLLPFVHHPAASGAIHTPRHGGGFPRSRSARLKMKPLLSIRGHRGDRLSSSLSHTHTLSHSLSRDCPLDKRERARTDCGIIERSRYGFFFLVQRSKLRRIPSFVA